MDIDASPNTFDEDMLEALSSQCGSEGDSSPVTPLPISRQQIPEAVCQELSQAAPEITPCQIHGAFQPSNTRNANQTMQALDKAYNFSIMEIPQENHVKASIDIYALVVQSGGTRELYEKVIARVNAYTSGVLPALQSHYLARDSLRKSFPVKSKKYSVCKNGCKMFSEESKSGSSTNSHCEHCGNSADMKTMQQLSLKDQLALLVHDKETRHLLAYRSGYESNGEVLNDIFDGSIYNIVKPEFSGNLDIALGIFTDDFSVLRRAKHTMTIIHVVILNFPPEERTLDKNMLQICVCPGPNKVSDITSFLQPTIDELSELCKTGINVNTEFGILNVKAHLLFVGGDIPASAKISGQASHRHYHGCRHCNIEGVYFQNRMIFLPTHRNRATKSDPRLNSTFSDDKNPASGQKRKALFTALPTFHGPIFFPIDCMHLLGINIAGQFWKMICGDYGKEGNPLYLSSGTRHEIGKLIAESRSSASAFSGECGDISYQSGFYRATDWMHFMLYFMSTIVLEYYIDSTTRSALVDLYIIYQCALSRSITKSQIKDLKSAVQRWHKWLLDHVQAGSMSPTVWTINQHYLSHLHVTIERLGPLPYFATFAMERAIGQIKKHINSKRDPGANSSNILVELAAIRRRKRIDEDGDGKTRERQRPTQILTMSEESDVPEIWGPLTEVTIEEIRCQNALASFWSWHFGSREGVNTIAKSDCVTTGGRLWKAPSDVFGGAHTSFIHMKTLVNTDKSTRQVFKKEHMHYFGDIKIFFSHTFKNVTKLLVLVQVYKTKKVDSPWPYKLASGSKIRVFQVEDIIGYAACAKTQAGHEHNR